MGKRDETRRAFLDAAGRLFADKGIDGVSLAEIAKTAGVDASMIHYHFGGKEGLVQAVIENALGKWHENDMRKYYTENEALLETRDGQILFVTGLVDCVFRTLGTDADGDPAKSLLLQLIQHPHPLRSRIVERHIKPNVRIFCEIYRRITGNEDFESAFCWYLLLICPRYLCTACPGMIDLFHPEGRVPDSFNRRLRHHTVKLLLAGFGLNEK